jgi:hypothetical protein
MENQNKETSTATLVNRYRHLVWFMIFLLVFGVIFFISNSLILTSDIDSDLYDLYATIRIIIAIVLSTYIYRKVLKKNN